ncbi:LrgB family protein [Pseudoalteromonas obscura]|uniref:LrgB family protein n=1 Tax=Pseudoalteromonas obscura TaxID=3048491 RepID=A0ABT7EHH1_9GAMM|nr:LrgB family protein [Pseudoalteromonas sp. P94(2023)]MDK2594490.1 LrgB family protein [Pseudoalteromonas sp. P94(2023)]
MTSILVCILTIGLFLVARQVYKSWPSPLLNPVLICITIITLVLLLTGYKYPTYFQASIPIDWFLEPAVVALAYPLYQQYTHIKSAFKLLIFCAFIGVSVSTIFAYALCVFMQADSDLTSTMMALSVTSPITLLITESLGGVPSIAAAMVILIGVFGGVFGLKLLTLLNISQPQAKGIALGVSCHAIGTAAAMEYHPLAGAFASVAMILSAIISAFWVPILFTILNSLYA